MNAFSSPTACFEVITWVAGVGLLLSAVQQLLCLRDYEPGQVFDWAVLGLNFADQGRPYFRFLSALLTRSGFVAILLTRVAGLVAVLVAPDGWVRAAGCAVITLTLLAAQFRYRYGQEGSDQMFFLVSVVLTVRALAGSEPGVEVVCLWFLALQLALAYFTAGAAKIVSPVWRSSVAVVGVLATREFGNRRLALALAARPSWCRLAAWSVMLFELLFPLVFVTPHPYCLGFVAAGLLFHLSCAAVMRLDQFVWAFASAYPAAVYCAVSVTTH